MGQLNFLKYMHGPGLDYVRISNGTLSFFPFNVEQSISWSILNFHHSRSGASMTHTFNVGLYSLNGATLSMANSISRTFSSSGAGGRGFVSMSDVSSAQNITPGTWFLGILAFTGGNSGFDFGGNTSPDTANAFPGGFIGGRMTASTAALPASYATADLDITGRDAMNTVNILLTT